MDKATSIKKGNRPRVPYWKIAVYGRAEIPGWQFVYKPGSVWAINLRRRRAFQGKATKLLKSLHMFENGL